MMVRTLRWEVILDYPGGPKVITMVLTRERGRRQRSDEGAEAGWCCWPLLASQMKEGATGQRTQSLGGGKSKEADSSLDTPKECSPVDTLTSPHRSIGLLSSRTVT